MRHWCYHLPGRWERSALPRALISASERRQSPTIFIRYRENPYCNADKRPVSHTHTISLDITTAATEYLRPTIPSSHCYATRSCAFVASVEERCAQEEEKVYRLLSPVLVSWRVCACVEARRGLSTHAQRRYSNAGGGGERVLWTAVAFMQRTEPDVISVVYSGDTDATKEQIIAKVKVRAPAAHDFS